MPCGIALNLLASALTILASIVFLGAATMVGETPIAVPAEQDDGSVARDFYEAINEALRTGDTAALDRVTTSDFHLHGRPPGGNATLVDLKRHLAAMHAVAPGMHLGIEELIVAGDHAVVRLVPDPGTSGTFLGIPLETTSTFWGRVDAIRVADDRVAEIWGGMEGPKFEALNHVQLDPLPTSQRLTFERLSSAAADSWISQQAFESRVIYIDAGELTVSVDPASRAPATIASSLGRAQERVLEPGTRSVMVAGDVLRVYSETHYALHHSATQARLRAYVVAFPGVSYVGPLQPNAAEPAPAAHQPPTAQPMRQMLVEGRVADVSPEPVVVSFGRISLAPGTPLSLAMADGPHLLHVEAGSLEIETVQAGGNHVEPNCDGAGTDESRLATGDATLVPVGASATYRAGAGESLVALVVTFLPSHAVPREAA